MADVETHAAEVRRLRAEIACLWQPHDRLLVYVQVRVERLAELGIADPWPHRRASAQKGERADDR